MQDSLLGVENTTTLHDYPVIPSDEMRVDEAVERVDSRTCDKQSRHELCSVTF